MAYPYPRVNKPRPYTNMCPLPHIFEKIDTYSECVAAMEACRDGASRKYQNTGDATQAQYSQLFHMAAHGDTLTKVDNAATATTGAANSWDYQGTCRALLTKQSKERMWPAVKNATVKQLQMYHASMPSQNTNVVPTTTCLQSKAADGSYICATSGNDVKKVALTLPNTPVVLGAVRVGDEF